MIRMIQSHEYSDEDIPQLEEDMEEEQKPFMSAFLQSTFPDEMIVDIRYIYIYILRIIFGLYAYVVMII